MKTEGMGSGSGESQPSLLFKEMQEHSGALKPALHSELWHACAGPLVSLPAVGSLVYYFPQGHIEQVAVSTKRLVTSQIPNYPNLPSQLICQVHNVILHADKDTDEIFAQMSLQPIKTEKDVLLIPDFGLKASKHPAEFFCKTLTASDTSTHGGFSVPRRAAEKLFPPLDYTMQPPFQELVVKDLHNNTWTFRHIYRGQPKRHLLTTGWSVFVGSKRLRAGDAVLFIRDEKGQLMVGVRRANRQQTTLPSSVLSADSMHIGVLAAAAHAAANRTPFTVFYNPRACPTEFVIPATKYRKAIYGTQTSIGMRFGMMFETEESGKRRYMGTIIGVSDLDPLRWPGSKWRNLQVEWDEPGCGDKQNRVSAWEIETPESLFLFPSLTSGFKRSFHPGFIGEEPQWGSMIKRPFIQLQGTGNGNLAYASHPNFPPEHLSKMLMRAENLSYPASLVPSSRGPTIEEAKTNFNMSMIQKPQYIPSQNSSVKNYQQQSLNQPGRETQEQDSTNTIKLPTIAETTKSDSLGDLSQLVSAGFWNEDKVASNISHSMNQLGAIAAPDNQKLIVTPEESSALRSQLTDVPPLDISGLDNLFQYMDAPDWPSYHSSVQTFGGASQPSGSRSMLGKLSGTVPEVILPLGVMGQELWDQSHNLNDVKNSTQTDQFGSFSQFSDDTINQSGIYSCIDVDVARCGNAAVDVSASNAVLNNLCSSKQATFHYSAELLIGNSTQDLQSQITSASIPDSQAFLRDCPDNSGGTSSSNVDFDESSLLQNNSWQQMVPPMRTYTKVQKAGSVGRSIDVTSFKDYEELLSAIERMFGLESLLNDPKGSGWKLVYVDFENDVLLVGDDPWEEFVGCVRCIRILSLVEVQQMSEEGMQLFNGNTMPGIDSAL